ncbi:MAG: hypothetical protein AUJ52_04150 [Elusimicrobia bacterium CG1_02_63_36]|nr:MAG: hypothetical protein AUJ52_04150 [Elusimicrobia bacterium CG1_02_63_36]PIP84127.1 MAG: RNA polymerase subunit sigma-24 [Elusimicrobia bacterium CG22_combo_CG10-13_8_21_14_all_63_91]PJA16452.1 MAG: RNA polymerase subunit sigma-24 [Elusimicrobia bacterium CG_4_10_14_0_2_um_filter_63_34]PJB25673.1 MAG: RNA polymerase subunit sigma-24 [Elusimicrobia bacterium CG_4_9_14_3_um_filter_62_55]
MNPPPPKELLANALNPAYHLALRLTGNESDAWDLTHDAMQKALAALPRFRGESAPRTWVYRIVVNLWKDRSASAGVRFRSRMLAIDEESVGGCEPRPEDLLERAENSRMIETAMDSLEPADRRILIMREFAGLSYRVIGKAAGVPIGTVKSRLSRARRALRRAIEAALIVCLLLAAAALFLNRPRLSETLRRVVSQLNFHELLGPR